MRRSHPRKLSVALVFSLAFFSCQPKIPRIDSLDPKIGKGGEPLTIKGENFGNERDESYVTIAGVSPTNSSYLSWRDNQIVIKTPELGESGLVYVYAKGRKSNGVLFTNQAGLPMPVKGEDIGIGPRIVSVSPHAGPIGSLLTITGSNFGSSRGRGAVFFAWEGDVSPTAPSEAGNQEFIEASEFGYELWSDREIRVRIPDGAASGNIELRSPRGNSRPYFIDISGKPGTKAFRDKRSYTLSYSANIKVTEANGSNALYLWMPRPAASAAQRNIEPLSHNTETFLENFRGSSLYKLSNLASGAEAHINVAYKVDVYALETNVRPQALKQDDDSPGRALFAQADSLIPSDDPAIKNQANVLTGRERNPYLKAQRIYEWLLSENIVQEDPGTEQSEGQLSPVEALAAKRADPYAAVLLYCALARASGIPCVPVAGVLVNRNRQTLRHYWVEFWIDGFGWIPVDPGLGVGAVPAAFQTRPDRASFYFGNIDSQRIAFSRGLANLSQMDPHGRVIGRTRSYAFQNIWEEATGGLESYSSLWGNITITGIYAQ
jgi:transglutaminase-like putative cysteine protease